MTHSTMLIWPRLGSIRFRLYRLVQSLSPLTSLSILLYCGAPGIVVYILTLVSAWKQEISLFLGGNWDHLFTSCIDVTQGFNDSSQYLRSSRRAWRSDLSCSDASGPRSSSVIWSSMADPIWKSPPPEFSSSIFIIDSPRLHPNTLPCGMPCTLCVLYVHAPRGWSRSQCDPCWGWCHGKYPCVVSIMNTDGCRLRSAGGRRQVASISALFRVWVQVPESIRQPRKQA